MPTDGVLVVRGRTADERASRHAARATSTADTIHLPDRHGPLGTPEADALLAHELVHVRARRRAPATDVANPAARTLEEQVARVVEAEVRDGRRAAPRPSARAGASRVAGLPADRAIVDADPRKLDRPRTVRAPDPASAATQPQAEAEAEAEAILVPAPDGARSAPGAGQRMSQGPGSWHGSETSRAPEAPGAATPSDDDQQIDRLARLLAERLGAELAAGRERGGGALDLSRW